MARTSELDVDNGIMERLSSGSYLRAIEPPQVSADLSDTTLAKAAVAAWIANPNLSRTFSLPPVGGKKEESIPCTP